MDPIATYAEDEWFDRQRFELYAERIIMYGRKLFLAQWQISHWLGDLNPTPVRGWLRKPAFGLGLFLGGITLALALYWVGVFGLERGEHAPIVLGGVGLGGLGLALANVRRRPFATFSTGAGVPVFSIRGAARSAARYEAFVDALVRQITLAKQPA